MENSTDSQRKLEDRLTDLETKIAFQDHSIAELHQLVREQQDQIDRLNLNFKKAQEQASIHPDEGIIDMSLEVPPPHY